MLPIIATMAVVVISDNNFRYDILDNVLKVPTMGMVGLERETFEDSCEVIDTEDYCIIYNQEKTNYIAYSD
jgi:hypothetical protein